MNRMLSLLTVCFLTGANLHAQTPVIKWQKTLGGSGSDELRAIVPTPDGGYIVGGGSNSLASGEKTENNRCLDQGKCGNDYWIVKLDDTGGIQWQHTYGCDPSDELRSIDLTSDGGYIVGGSSAAGRCADKTDTLRGTANNDYWILKLNSTGVIQWQKTIGGNYTDDPAAVRQTSDGGYIVGGTTQSRIFGDKAIDNWGTGTTVRPNDFWIVRLDDTGRIRWQKVIGGTTSDALADIRQTSDGGFIVGGTSGSPVGGNKTEPIRGASTGVTDYWVLKLDNAGDIEWQKVMGGNANEVLSSIMQTPDGGYIVGGHSMSNQIVGERTDVRRGVGEDYWILKLNSTGDIVWQKTIGGFQSNKLCNIQPTSDGGYIAGGTSTSDASGEKAERSWNATNDYWVLKLNAAGDIQWQKTIGGDGDDQLAQVREVAPNEYILGGRSGSSISGNKTEASRGGAYDYWIVKLHFQCDTTAHYQADSFCRSVPFRYTLPGGRVVSETGIYRDSFLTASGCDSVHVTAISQFGPDVSVRQSGNTLTAQARGVFYQWINCAGGAIAGADNPSFTPEEEGRYAVVVTSNNCSDTSDCFTAGSANAVSVHASAGMVRIFPNPSSGMVRIEAAGLLHVRIRSMDGRVVLRHEQVSVFDVRDLPAGVYLLQLTDENGNLVLSERLVRTAQ